MRVSKQGAAMLRRLAKAARIVRSGRLIQANGAWIVTSETGHTYAVNGACQCEDARHPARSGGWCKHRLAAWLAEELGKGKQTFGELYGLAVRGVLKKHPAADGENSGRVQGHCGIEDSGADRLWQARGALADRVRALERRLAELEARLEADERLLTQHEQRWEVWRQWPAQ